MGVFSRLWDFLKRTRIRPLEEWYTVTCDEEGVTLDVRPRWKRAWTERFCWKDVIRVCFEARDYLQSDCVYVFTSGRAESHVIPLDAKGGKEFWGQVLDRRLFDAELAIVAAGAATGLFCWPEPGVQVGADEGESPPRPGSDPIAKVTKLTLRVTMVDYAPDDLYGQTPFEVDILRQVRAFDRDDYWLGKLRRPLLWKRDGDDLSILHVLLAHRWVGQLIQPGIHRVAVEIGFVTEAADMEDDEFDYPQVAHVAIGLATDVTGEIDENANE